MIIKKKVYDQLRFQVLDQFYEQVYDQMEEDLDVN